MGGYRVPEWKQSIRQNLFDVEIEGQSFQLVKAEYMTGDQVQALQVATSSGDPSDLYGFLDELCPGLGTAMRPVPMKFLNEFVQAWQKDSGMDLGESLASTDSSEESTERPSSTISSPAVIA